MAVVAAKAMLHLLRGAKLARNNFNSERTKAEACRFAKQMAVVAAKAMLHLLRGAKLVADLRSKWRRLADKAMLHLLRGAKLVAVLRSKWRW